MFCISCIQNLERLPHIFVPQGGVRRDDGGELRPQLIASQAIKANVVAPDIFAGVRGGVQR